MAAGRDIRALRSSAKARKRDLQKRKLDKWFGADDPSGRQGMRLTRGTGGQAAARQHNARNLVGGNFYQDDKRMARARKCFRNNMLRGMGEKAAFAACGLSTSRSSQISPQRKMQDIMAGTYKEDYRKGRGSTKRDAIIGLDQYDY